MGSSDKFESEFSEKEDYEISAKEIENNSSAKDEPKLQNTEEDMIHQEDEEDIKNGVTSEGKEKDLNDEQEEVAQFMKSTAYIVLKKENKSNKRLQMLVWKKLFKCCLVLNTIHSIFTNIMLPSYIFLHIIHIRAFKYK